MVDFGDFICYMTAISYMKKTYKFLDIHLFCPEFFVPMAENLVPNITVHSFSNIHKEWNDKCAAKQTKNVHTTLGTHIIDHGFHVLMDKDVEKEHKNYCKFNGDGVDISKYNLPEKYVVVTTGFTAPVREMLPEVVNKVAQYIISKGYTPVFLGKRQSEVGFKDNKLVGNFKDEIDYSVGIDLIDSTDLLEAAKIIEGAKTIVGLDNGLLHVAGCTNIPIISGFTTVKPEHRLPYRNSILGFNCYAVVPDTNLKCRFCQSNWEFQYGPPELDYKFCYYKDYKCIKNLEAKKYIFFLDKIL